MGTARTLFGLETNRKSFLTGGPVQVHAATTELLRALRQCRKPISVDLCRRYLNFLRLDWR